MLQGYIPILILFVVALAFGLGSVAASSLLGPRRPTKEKLSTYECGMTVEPDARRAVFSVESVELRSYAAAP